MADPFTELGLSRRPLFQMFGLPEDRGASSPLMERAVQEDRIQQAAQMKLDQDIADIERRGQAEAAADEFMRQNPDAAIAGSSRFGDIQRYQMMQQRGPSYSDQVLSRSLANRLKPAARERFYQYLEDGRGANQAFDDAEADEEDMQTRIGLVEAGLPLEALKPFEGQRIDPLRAAALKASLKGGGKDPAMQALESNFDVLRKEYEDARSLGEVSPELEQEYLGTRNELLKRRRSLYAPTPPAEKPIVDAVAAGSMGAPAAPAPASAAPPPAGGFMEAMRKAAKPEDVLRVDEQEVVAGVNDPSADENTFVAAIKDTNVSLPVKQQALARLNEYIKNPPPLAGATVSDAIRRREQLSKLRDEAEKDVAAFPVVQQYNQTWQAVKGKMDQALDGFAKSLGVSKEQVINSLNSGDRIFVDQRDVEEGGTSIRELFERYFGEAVGKNPDSPAYPLHRKVDELEPFKDSEFADRIGMSGFLGTGFNASKKWKDVLDVYLSENANPAAPVSTPNKAGIKSIKPIP